MIIIYSNDDYKATVLKYCLFIKEMSFLVVKKRKSQRLNVSSIEDLNTSCLYDNLKTIEEINDETQSNHEKNELNSLNGDFNDTEKFPNEIEINFNNEINEKDEDNFKYSQNELKEHFETIDQSSLPSLTKVRKKAEYFFNFAKKNKQSTFSDSQPLIIEDIIIAIRYLDDKLDSPYLFPVDLIKRHMFFHVLNDINQQIILPFIKIEDLLKKFLGFDEFVRMSNRPLAKKTTKSIYNELIIFDDFNKSLLKLLELLYIRFEKKHLLFNYISIIDILILPLFFRLNLIDYFKYYPHPEKYNNLFKKIMKLSEEQYCKKACFNKCNGQIVH